MKTTIFYSGDLTALNDAVAKTLAGEVTLARYAPQWRGEVEDADVCIVYGNFPEIAEAYNVECTLPQPEPKKLGRLPKAD